MLTGDAAYGRHTYMWVPEVGRLGGMPRSSALCEGALSQGELIPGLTSNGPHSAAGRQGQPAGFVWENVGQATKGLPSGPMVEGLHHDLFRPSGGEGAEAPGTGLHPHPSPQLP